MVLGDTVKKSNFKDISKVMSNFLCLYSYAYFTLLLKSEKRVTERNKRQSLKPIY